MNKLFQKIVATLLIFNLLLHITLLHPVNSRTVSCKKESLIKLESIDFKGNCEHNSVNLNEAVGSEFRDYCEDSSVFNDVHDYLLGKIRTNYYSGFQTTTLFPDEVSKTNIMSNLYSNNSTYNTGDKLSGCVILLI